MATLIRTTKSGSEWTKNELWAYNITVIPQDVASFFGNPILPEPSVHRVILDHEECPANGIADRDDRNFFYSLEEAMAIRPGEESAGEEFAALLLKLVGYNVGDRLIRRQKDIPFLICGGETHAGTDVCVMDENVGILLVVQEDKWQMDGPDPEPWLIAEGIAAFQHNNTRLRGVGLQALQAKTIPGITMIGSAPTFYKMTITQDVVDAVETGQYPEKQTRVHKLVPPVDDVGRLNRSGMKPLNNRAVILRCFEAFKQFV